ncbi:hypothetical protein THIOSC13_1200018 [uncultured Thiomicrorhabdus sp.]
MTTATSLTATEKAKATRLVEALAEAASLRIINEEGKPKPHALSLRQLIAVLEVSAREGQQQDTYTHAGDNKAGISRNLWSISTLGSSHREQGFDLIQIETSREDRRKKEAYMTDKGVEFVKDILKLLE